MSDERLMRGMAQGREFARSYKVQSSGRHPITHGEWVQVGLAIFYGAFPYYMIDPNDLRARFWDALIVGVVGSYLTTFLYVWIRWGWRTAWRMKINGN
jgi:hypothetical protein